MGFSTYKLKLQGGVSATKKVISQLQCDLVRVKITLNSDCVER